jgi:hypothetical protein
MSFRNLFGVVFLGLGLSAAAHAQLGVYGMYSVNQNTGVQCLVDSPNTCSNGVAGRTSATSASGTVYGSPSTGHVNPQGLSGGVFYDFKTYGPVRFGVDVRGGDAHSNKSASDSTGGTNSTRSNYVLVGLRGSVRTPISWVKPYAQISVGYNRSNVTEPSCSTLNGGTLQCQNGQVTTTPARNYDNFLQYEGFVGADIRIASFIDWRAVEVGLGNMNRIGSSSVYDGNSSVGVRSLGAGVVLHLP